MFEQPIDNKFCDVPRHERGKRLTSGIASFSLISTGVLCIVRPIAMILLFFSMAYPVQTSKRISPAHAQLTFLFLQQLATMELKATALKLCSLSMGRAIANFGSEWEHTINNAARSSELVQSPLTCFFVCGWQLDVRDSGALCLCFDAAIDYWLAGTEWGASEWLAICWRPVTPATYKCSLQAACVGHSRRSIRTAGNSGEPAGGAVAARAACTQELRRAVVPG